MSEYCGYIMAAKRKRERLGCDIRFRGTRLDVRRLKALARLEELTPSAVLRRLIAEAYRGKGLGSDES
jgi:hypothetical protein